MEEERKPYGCGNIEVNSVHIPGIQSERIDISKDLDNALELILLMQKKTKQEKPAALPVPKPEPMPQKSQTRGGFLFLMGRAAGLVAKAFKEVGSGR
ncbi:MAG: hypothetical protein HQL30_11815 [Candidatus Omnitrophica bacterium]|nr:hypothetical protein [Candidatus Omnitrophota bacterium]